MDYNEYKNKVKEQIDLVENYAHEVLSVVENLEGLNDADRNRFIKAINSILNQAKQQSVLLLSGGHKHCLARLFNLKILLGKQMTEIINFLVDMCEKNAENEQAQKSALQLEQSLNELGIKLFRFAEGEKYDPTIDAFSSVIEKVDASADVPLYISKSHFGAKINDGYGKGRVIEKARIELVDKLEKSLS